MILVFRQKYLVLTTLLFVVEVLIALFVRDMIVRPFVGDLLVVILIYCFVRIFLNISYWKIAVGVLLFACVIEVLQYFHYATLLGFANNRAMKIILGTTFNWLDFVAYFAGFLVIISIETFWQPKREGV